MGGRFGIRQGGRIMPRLGQIAIGQRFGRLVTIEKLDVRTKGGDSQYSCKCDCGAVKTVSSYRLKIGKTKSCGCYRKETTSKSFRTHGLRKSPEYTVWALMISRCHNKNNKSYERYGSRGISVCDRWKNSFESFLADMGNRPADGLQIDRINNDGNYEPSNCRWVTKTENARNKRSNVVIKYNGQSATVAEWGERIGINAKALRLRLFRRNWSIEKSLSTPLKRNQHA